MPVVSDRVGCSGISMKTRLLHGLCLFPLRFSVISFFLCNSQCQSDLLLVVKLVIKFSNCRVDGGCVFEPRSFSETKMSSTFVSCRTVARKDKGWYEIQSWDTARVTDCYIVEIVVKTH